MTQLDLAIRGGTIVTASDEFRADIGIREGRIVSIADCIEGAAREIDATGLLALRAPWDLAARPTSGTVLPIVNLLYVKSLTCAY